MDFSKHPLNPGYYSLGPGVGYYLQQTPIDVLNELKTQIDPIKQNFNVGEKYNEFLVGEIEHEYGLIPKPNLKNYIKSLTHNIEQKCNLYKKKLEENSKSSLDFWDLWVNFQKKHEYNPPHCHSGIYSFVIWYKIPYLISDENTYYGYKNKEVLHGKFSFLYNSPIEGIKTTPLPIDNTCEGMAVIFPSRLNHMVYPFYSSDKYRITVAGNVHVKYN